MVKKLMQTLLPFYKYSGNGNDFIILDSPQISFTSDLVERLCNRHFGVGADGVLLLTKSVGVDIRMQIYNADGGEAEMCANGLRCVASFIDDQTIQRKDSYKIKTMNGTYEVIRKGDSFAIEMSEIKDKNIYDLSVFLEFEKSFYINTGVPHLVFLSKDIKEMEIQRIAPRYRFHSLFPKGTNVGLVEIEEGSTQSAYVRTYERGVEDETYSCGTGLTAAGLALQEWMGWCGTITLKTKGGVQKVEVGEKVFYSGQVSFCYQGNFPL